MGDWMFNVLFHANCNTKRDDLCISLQIGLINDAIFNLDRNSNLSSTCI